MRIVYSRLAINDIESTIRYIAEKLLNPTAADSFKKVVFENIERLKGSPHLGTRLPGFLCINDADFRKLVVGKHLIIYEVSDTEIRIKRVSSGRMDWIAILSDKQSDRNR